MKRQRLGDADEMFHRLFRRWYGDAVWDTEASRGTRPDLMTLPKLVGKKPTDICRLSKSDAKRELTRVNAMMKAAGGDWPSYLELRKPISITWIEPFDRSYDLKRATDLANRSDPADFSNDYLVVVCEFGAVLGKVLQDLLPRLKWVASWPYWESSLFDSTTGNIIPVFHWAIKKFSTYGIDDGFAEKVQACVQMLRDSS